MGFFAFSGASVAQPTPVAAAVPEEPPSISVTMTGYNAVPWQTDSDPMITASGAYSNPEVIAARSSDLAKALPFGTIIEVRGPAAPVVQGGCGYAVVAPSIGYRVVADAMNPKFTKRVDVLLPDANEYRLDDGTRVNAAVELGVCRDVTVKVVGHIDITNPARMPKTQAELAAIVATQSAGELAVSK